MDASSTPIAIRKMRPRRADILKRPAWRTVLMSALAMRWRRWPRKSQNRSTSSSMTWTKLFIRACSRWRPPAFGAAGCLSPITSCGAGEWRRRIRKTPRPKRLWNLTACSTHRRISLQLSFPCATAWRWRTAYRSNRFHRNRRQVFDQPHFLLQEGLAVFHADKHAVKARHGFHAAANVGLGREVGPTGFLVGELRFVGIDGFQPLFKLRSDIHNEARPDVVVKRGVNDFEWPIRFAGQIQFGQSGQETRFVAQL